jgi:hypothetical protein
MRLAIAPHRLAAPLPGTVVILVLEQGAAVTAAVGVVRNQCATSWAGFQMFVRIGLRRMSLDSLDRRRRARRLEAV